METKEEIFNQLKEILVSMLEVDENTIKLDSHLYEDLDLDSIDTIDMVIKLQDMLNKKISPEEFKSARTIQDIIDAVYGLLQD